MMELGNHEPETLWSTIYKKTKAEFAGYASAPSLEKRYIGYRYSTFGKYDRIVKSFVVLQSPGAIREHFAFKVFYKSGAGQLRKSAGAIVSLGKTVTCFGSSRMLLEGDTFGGLGGDFNQVTGPKTVVMDSAALKSNDPLLPCHLLSVNEHEEAFSGRMICVQTRLDHSRRADIGSFALSKLDDELGKFTVFGDGQPHECCREHRDKIWELILRSLRRPEGSYVETTLTKRDLNLRGVTEA